jgi:hypothetical protein
MLKFCVANLTQVMTWKWKLSLCDKLFQEQGIARDDQPSFSSEVET